MNFLPGWFPSPGTKVVPVEIEYLGAETWEVPNDTQTFDTFNWTGAPFGTASEDRIIGIVAAAVTGISSPAMNLSSFSIGGSAASIAAQVEITDGDNTGFHQGRLAFGYRLVPSGTSGNIQVVMSRGFDSFIAHAFSIKKSDGSPIGLSATRAQNLNLGQNVVKGAGMIAASVLSCGDGINPSTTMSGLANTRITSLTDLFGRRAKLRSGDEDELVKTTPKVVTAVSDSFENQVSHVGLSVQFVPA